ncbi:unnamed protein product [Callosobruchus maculatus]|uniref:F-ATPase protein 6 n=1 Tax=Callosobruchus maculatus TaxID=64391 RepID=A0A653BF47_CALMS|nr:unnamed protein product [Callosobruchus maculatus]
MDTVTDSDDYTSDDRKRKNTESISPFKAVKKLNRTPQKKICKGDIEHSEDIREMLRTAYSPIFLQEQDNFNIIRPGTLSIRLSANIIAGHLLITLLGRTGPSLSLFIINILIMTQILLLILETAVSIIQSYVFVVLRTLYSREVN